MVVKIHTNDILNIQKEKKNLKVWDWPNVRKLQNNSA